MTLDSPIEVEVTNNVAPINIEVGAVGIQGAPGTGGSVAGDYYLNSNPSGFINIKPTLALTFISAPIQWPNMPLSDAFFNGQASNTQFIDLTNFTGVSLCITRGGNVANATAMLQLRYSPTYSLTIGDYVPLTTTNLYSYLVTPNVHINSGFYPIVNAARSGVFVALMGSGGNGLLDPNFGNTVAYFK